MLYMKTNTLCQEFDTFFNLKIVLFTNINRNKCTKLTVINTNILQ